MKDPVDGSYSQDIKPETILLSAILLNDSLFQNEGLFAEINGVTLRKALYNALGEVSQVARHRWSFATKVQSVMALRYGLLDGKRRTLEEIGQSIGMTRQGIFNIQRAALDYLKQPRWRKALILYVKPEHMLRAHPKTRLMAPMLRKGKPANWIVVLRKERKLNQTEFAKLIGTSVRTLQSWEAGLGEPKTKFIALLKKLESD